MFVVDLGLSRVVNSDIALLGGGGVRNALVQRDITSSVH